MDIQYKNMKIRIVKKDQLVINNKTIDSLDITIEKDNCLINLGNFYSDISIKDNIEYFITNIDSIMFNKYRYVGNDEDIIDYIQKHTTNNVNIRDIYLEYINTPSNNKENKKYKRFLEMYFCNHEIPDEIRKVYLEKERKSILDYNDIDNNIRKEFNGSMGDVIAERNHELDLDEFNKLKIKVVKLDKEIELLKIIILRINELLELYNINEKNFDKIKELTKEVNNMYFFDKRKKDKKIEIYNLKTQLESNSIIEKKKEIKELINEYAIKYNDSYGLNVLFNSISLNDLLGIVKNILVNKEGIYNNLENNYKTIEDRVNNYDELIVDISDLYERIEKVKV